MQVPGTNMTAGPVIEQTGHLFWMRRLYPASGINRFLYKKGLSVRLSRKAFESHWKSFCDGSGPRAASHPARGCVDRYEQDVLLNPGWVLEKEGHAYDFFDVVW